MNKIKLILNVNSKINFRINSDKHPILYYWLQSIGIKVPPEIFAFLLLIDFLIIILLGLVSEITVANKNHYLEPIFSLFILIIIQIVVEILIKLKDLNINNLLLKILPFSRKEYLILNLSIHYLSLRLFSFISFIILYCVFSYSYELILWDSNFINILFLFFNVFLIISSISFFLITVSKSLLHSKNINPKIQYSLRLLLFFVVLVVVKKITQNNYLVTKNNTFYEFSTYIKYIFFVSIIVFLTSVFSCFNKSK